MQARSPASPGALPRPAAPPLTLAALAAMLASGCCVLPLLLALLGLSGAWTSQLRWLQPYSGPLALLALAALGMAGWRLYRPQPLACDTQEAQACQRSNLQVRRWFWWVAVLTLLPLVLPLVAPLFYE